MTTTILIGFSTFLTSFFYPL